MKKLISIFTVFLLSFTTFFAQGHSISYDIDLSYDCNGMQGMLVQTGSAMEGDNIVIPSYKIPDSFPILKNYQDFLDVFAGAEIEIPVGTLKEDVMFKIMLNPIPCNYDKIDLKELVGMTVKVIGGGIEYPPMGYYMFNEGKQVTIKIKAANLLAYIKKMDMKLEDLAAWFVSEDLIADFKGISFNYTLGDKWVYVHVSHFSKIALGSKNSISGTETIVSVPSNYSLKQNYPNPFNPSTNISFSLPKEGLTKLVVYNSIGVEVAELIAENKAAGNYNISFDAAKYNLSSGIYFYQLSSGNFRSTKKMMLIK